MNIPRLELVVRDTVFFDDGSELTLPANVNVGRNRVDLRTLASEPANYVFWADHQHPTDGYPVLMGCPKNALHAVVLALLPPEPEPVPSGNPFLRAIQEDFRNAFDGPSSRNSYAFTEDFEP